MISTAYLLASERSELDTYRGKNEKIGDVYLYITSGVLSTNGERALNYTIVIQTTKIKSSC